MMKKIITLLMCLVCCCSYAFLYEGNSGDWLSEDITAGSGGGEPITKVTLTFQDGANIVYYPPIVVDQGTVVDLTQYILNRDGFVGNWRNSNNQNITSITMTATATVSVYWANTSHKLSFIYTKADNTADKSSVSIISFGRDITSKYPTSTPAGLMWDNPEKTMPNKDLYIKGRIRNNSFHYVLDCSNRTPRIYYADDTAGLTPVTIDNTGNVSLGSWESWIDEHFTPVMLKDDGTVDYELSRTDQRYKSDGITPSDIDNLAYNGHAMVKIKKFYVKYVASGTYIYNIYVSDTNVDGSYKCNGFIDADGVEQDYAYVAMFNTVDSGTKPRSLVKSSQKAYIYTSDAYDDIYSLGRGFGGWNQGIYDSLKAALYLVTCESNQALMWNLYNRGTTTSADEDTGSTADKGAFVRATATSRHYKMFWMEDLFNGGRWSYFRLGIVVKSQYIYTRDREPYYKTATHDATSIFFRHQQYYGSAVNMCFVTNGFLLPMSERTDTTSSYYVWSGYSNPCLNLDDQFTQNRATQDSWIVGQENQTVGINVAYTGNGPELNKYTLRICYLPQPSTLVTTPPVMMSAPRRQTSEEPEYEEPIVASESEEIQ